MNTDKEFILTSKETPFGCVGSLRMVDHEQGEITKICQILERPYLSNKPNISSVPGGFYYLKPYKSPRFGDTYYLESIDTNIVGLHEGKRTYILFHGGNTIHDSKGCLLPGSTFTIQNDELFIHESRKNMEKLLNLLDGYSYKLTINRF